SRSREITDAANTIIDPLGAIIDRKVKAIFDEHRTIVILVLSVSIVFLTLVILVTLFFFKTMSERLLGIRDAIQAIARGNVDTGIPFTQDTGETGDVARAVEEFRLNKVALSQALSEAVAAERAKTEFLGTMSHELRTPLNIVIGYSEAMKNGIFGELPEPYHEPASHILGSGTHLLNIINQVLDMVSLGNSGDSDTRSVLQLSTEIDPILRSVEAIRREKGVTIECCLPPQLFVMCNATHFRQIVTNVVDNALKFTGQGSSVSILADSGPDGQVVISVRDEGPGMSQREIERAVKPFVQIGDHLTRRHGGVGLGLAIVSRLCEMNAGSISFESAPGRGTTVHLTLPSGSDAALSECLADVGGEDQCLARAS
ncbi:MAG: HAMP domain-containing sensor histidine kinase, partial [Proteobacteria bacterium]|nr:HAMP domain-containing sensor histidine kinase [Pseudomonadota bacterium]